MRSKRGLGRVRILTEGAGVLFFVIAFLLLSLLISYNPEDPTPFYATDATEVHNLIGRAGAWTAAYLYYWLGFSAYLFVLFFIILGYSFLYHIVRSPSPYLRIIQRLAGLLLLFCTTGLFTLHSGELASALPASGGGVLGLIIAKETTDFLGFWGSNAVLIGLCLISFSLVTGLSWLQFLEVLGGAVLFVANRLHLRSLSQLPLIPKNLAINALTSFQHGIKSRQPTKLGDKSPASPLAAAKRRVEPNFVFMPGEGAKGMENHSEERKSPPINKEDIMTPMAVKTPMTAPVESTTPKAVSSRTEAAREPPAPSSLPSIDYLRDPETIEHGPSAQEYKESGERLVTALLDFGVSVQLKGYSPGPVVTLFELEPAAGVKAAKISALSKDLSRAMAVENVRVVEFIRGKSFIGIEIPNHQRKIVRMKELLASPEYKNSTSALPLALGQDTEGKSVVVSLVDMPHLLVAGTTGSGKSIGINVMLITLLYRYGPQELRLILIDPKMLELSAYNNIPHLLVPVITDMAGAFHSLNWCVKEMDERYALMTELGVRNIESYNRRQEQQARQEDNRHRHLPYLIIVIDEYADLIMTNKKIEQSIVRLAQKARAAGIHLILATQRPSVDVITGLIKANIPARISFKVSSRIDSRTVLDQSGAEQLLGRGDMLYSAVGGNMPIRVHGALIEDDEVHKVAAYWKAQEQPKYHSQVTKQAPSSQSTALKEEADELYNEAVQFIKENNRVSISSVQRKFKIGYNRAARIIELMEANGLVSSMDNMGKRTVIE